MRKPMRPAIFCLAGLLLAAVPLAAGAQDGLQPDASGLDRFVLRGLDDGEGAN